MRPLIELLARIPFLARIVFVVRAERARWRLSDVTHPAAAPIRRALRAAGLGTVSPRARRAVEEIEAIRSRLLATHDELRIIDYGAGSSRAALSEAEMAEGRSRSLTVAEACAFSKPQRWAMLLFHLVRELRPEVCVEMGTCVGISAAYQAAALQLNGRGRLITLEGAAPLAHLATGTVSELGLDAVTIVEGRFQDTLERVMQENAPVDFIFVDGHHDEQATLGYFDQVRPHLSTGALLVFDDIRWSPGMTRAWRAISTSPHTALAVDLGAVGLTVLGAHQETT